MTFLFNGQSRDGEAGLTLHALLLNEGYGVAGEQGEPVIRPGLAVAINEQVIPRSSWSQQPIVAGDKVELFQVIAGG